MQSPSSNHCEAPTWPKEPRQVPASSLAGARAVATGPDASELMLAGTWPCTASDERDQSYGGNQCGERALQHRMVPPFFDALMVSSLESCPPLRCDTRVERCMGGRLGAS